MPRISRPRLLTGNTAVSFQFLWRSRDKQLMQNNHALAQGLISDTVHAAGLLTCASYGLAGWKEKFESV
jgi:hypothetical protein